MRVLIVTDAWYPQINGVVRTLERLALDLRAQAVQIDFITPLNFKTCPMPFYPEIRLSMTTPHQIGALIDSINPDALHIATEGPLGLCARYHAKRTARPFTTCFHTRYPQYISARLPIAESLIYSLLRWFHNGAVTTMVATDALKAELHEHGFTQLALWSRGVDADMFKPRADVYLHLPRPIFLYVGRVAVEKNLEALLSLDLPGSTLIIGDGPDRVRLQEKYPHAHFWGIRTGEDLAHIYSGADVFVFPSLTDTFGLVLLEALASGLPVAAFPVAGPLSAMETAQCAVLSQDLKTAALQAMLILPEICRAHALTYSHARSAQQFLDNITAAVTTNELISTPTLRHTTASLSAPQQT